MDVWSGRGGVDWLKQVEKKWFSRLALDSGETAEKPLWLRVGIVEGDLRSFLMMLQKERRVEVEEDSLAKNFLFRERSSARVWLRHCR